MKVKGIISEEKVTLPEMRSVLLGVESERLAAEKEMSYEFRRSIEHANQLAKTTRKSPGILWLSSPRWRR